MADNGIKFNTVWYQGFKGNGKIKSGDSLKTTIAIPENKGGSGDGADPFRILVSSAIACYTATLTYMLHQSKLPVSGFCMDTEASESRTGDIEITHAPHLILSREAGEDQVAAGQALFAKADAACHVGNLLRQTGAQIRVAGQVSLVADGDEISDYVERNGLDW